VKIDTVAGETVLDNQDGDREQENIDYFQVTDEADAGEDQTVTGTIRLRNDDFEKKKFFYLSYETDVPQDWRVEVNEGKLAVTLEPNEVRDIPVVIAPLGPAVVGSVFGVDVMASSQRELVSDLDPTDVHLEFDPLGGARIETRVLERAEIVDCQVQSGPQDQIIVTGTVKSPNFTRFWDQGKPLAILLQGRDIAGNSLPGTTTVVRINRDGTFGGPLNTQGNNRPADVIVMFAGTDMLTSAGCGPLIVGGGGSIHGIKYHDLNGNGQRDRGEPGIEGWTIFLDRDNDGNLDRGERATKTMADNPRTINRDESGMYSFDIAPGSYVVAEVPNKNWLPTAPHVGVDAPLGFITTELTDLDMLLQLVPRDITIAGPQIRDVLALGFAWDHNQDILYTVSGITDPDTLAST
jgi:hypothetical protein